MIKSPILISQKKLFNYVAQGNYYAIETKFLFLIPLFHKTLKQKTVANLLKYQKKICYNFLQKIMQMRVSKYYNKKDKILMK